MSVYDVPLLNTQELVERTIYHSMRKHCVSRGYLPDIYSFDQNAQGYREYLEAFSAIVDDKGFAIEVFNSGPPTEREMKQVPRLILDIQGFVPGSIGGDQSQQYEWSEEHNKYYGFIAPPTTSDLYFNIHIVASNATQDRIMNALVSLAVPRRGYLPLYNAEDNFLFTNFLTYVPVNEYKTPGIMETMIRYVCPDLIEVADIPNTDPIIPPLTYFQIDLEEGDKP